MPGGDGDTGGESRPLLAKKDENQHYNLVGLSQRSFWILCLSMWVCSFLAAFDGTVVATLLGPISSSFMAANLASWLGTSYLLSVCCFTPIYGRLCNLIGRQRSMIISLAIFGTGNALCAAAPSMGSLIAARAFAGVGGGGLQTITSIIVSDIVPLSHRGIFQGYANIVFGCGVGLGPSLGGFISDTVGWRWAFWVQVPFFIICIFLARRYINYTFPAQKDLPSTFLGVIRRLDLPGCFLLAGWIGSALTAVSLVTNSTTGLPTWSSSEVIGLFVAAGVIFVVFVVWELKIVQYPVVPVEILHRRTPIAVAIHNMALSIIVFAQLYSVPLFYTTVRLMSAASAGRHLIPVPLFGMTASLGSGFYVRLTGKYYWLNFWCGMLGLLSSVLVSTWTYKTPEWRLWTDFPIYNLCASGTSTLTILALVGDVGREGIATATSLSYTARMSGQVIGAGIAGAITQAVLSRNLKERIVGPGSEEIIATIRRSSSSIQDLQEPYRTAAVLSYQHALHGVFMFCAVTGLVVVISGLFIREVDTKLTTQAKLPDDEAESVSR